MAKNRPKDRLKFKFNALEGKFDLVQEFNTDRVVTHNLSPFGNQIQFKDEKWGSNYDAGDMVVTDNDGNIVLV